MTQHFAEILPALETKSEGNGDAAIEVKTALDALTAEVKAKAEADKKLGERLDQVEQKLNRPNIITDKKGEPTEEQKSFDQYIRKGDRISADEVKTLTESSDTQGGYLAPAEFSSEFIRNLVQYSPIRQYASVRSTSAPSVIYPARTAVTNAAWKGETQDQTGSEPAFGQAEVPVNELNTFVDISNQLLADSAGAAEQEVRLALAEDFGAKEAGAFAVGTGVNQPLGFLKDTNIGVGKTAVSATAIASDELVDLLYSLPEIYRRNATWAMNTQTIAAVRKLKDGQGNYLWQPSYQAEKADTLLGRPIMEVLEMDDIGAGKTPIVLGDFSGYRVVDRVSMSILVNPYLLATKGVTRFHATRRVGGAVIQPAKFKKFKNA